MNTSRRGFIKKTALFTTGASLLSTASWANSRFSPNERINVGLIGCRNQGFYVLREFLQTGGVNCLGLCDIDGQVLDEKAAALKKEFQQTPKLYRDFREMLDDKEIDAVIIGTPDHWHCLQTVYACQAGKDVYVEKPLANSIGECNLMLEAAKKYNRIVQVGQQQRSSPVWEGVMDFIKSEDIGKLRKVNIWANFQYGVGAKKQPDEAVPAGVDFDLWLGPALERSFNPARFHGNWRHFWDYGGGLMTDWGVHLLDMALWAKDDSSEPEQVMAYGSNLSFDGYSRETYDTMSVIFPKNDYVINWQHAAGHQSGPYDMPYGVEFIADKATIVADRGKWVVKTGNPKDTEEAMAVAANYLKQSAFSDVGNHVRDFIQCVKSREAPSCSIEVGRNVALYAHMGNIAARSDAGSVMWDSKRQLFENNMAANALVMPQYRKAWELSSV
jgi:predicted dehydrogenase